MKKKTSASADVKKKVSRSRTTTMMLMMKIGKILHALSTFDSVEGSLVSTSKEYGNLLKDHTSYLDKTYGLTATRCMVLPAMLVIEIGQKKSWLKDQPV